MESSPESSLGNVVCMICSTGVDASDPEVTVDKKGLTTLVKAFKLRKKVELEEYFQEKLDDNCHSAD